MAVFSILFYLILILGGFYLGQYVCHKGWLTFPKAATPWIFIWGKIRNLIFRSKKQDPQSADQ